MLDTMSHISPFVHPIAAERTSPAEKGGTGLGVDLVRASLVPRREVEDLEAAHARVAAEQARLSRRQMIPLARLLDVFLEKRRLAKEEIRLAHELDDPQLISGAVERVHDVADLLPPRLDHQLA